MASGTPPVAPDPASVDPAEWKTYSANLETAHVADVARLNGIVATLTAEKATLAAQVTTLDTDKATLVADKAALDKRLADADVRIVGLKQQIDNLMANHAKLGTDFAIANGEVNRLNLEVAALTQARDAAVVLSQDALAQADASNKQVQAGQNTLKEEQAALATQRDLLKNLPGYDRRVEEALEMLESASRRPNLGPLFSSPSRRESLLRMLEQTRTATAIRDQQVLARMRSISLESTEYRVLRLNLIQGNGGTLLRSAPTGVADWGFEDPEDGARVYRFLLQAGDSGARFVIYDPEAGRNLNLANEEDQVRAARLYDILNGKHKSSCYLTVQTYLPTPQDSSYVPIRPNAARALDLGSENDLEWFVTDALKKLPSGNRRTADEKIAHVAAYSNGTVSGDGRRLVYSPVQSRDAAGVARLVNAEGTRMAYLWAERVLRRLGLEVKQQPPWTLVIE
jgi:hypothetical protein